MHGTATSKLQRGTDLEVVGRHGYDNVRAGRHELPQQDRNLAGHPVCGRLRSQSGFACHLLASMTGLHAVATGKRGACCTLDRGSVFQSLRQMYSRLQENVEGPTPHHKLNCS